MEYADVYDVKGNKTGKIVSKDGIENKDEYVMTVGLWIKDKNGRIFATRRSLDKSYMPGKWENTGGHVIAGESPEEAVVRELREETGIVIDKEKLIFLGEVVKWPSIGKNYGAVLEKEPERLVFSDGEVDDAKWLRREEFEEMCKTGEFASSVIAYLKMYLEGFVSFTGWENPDI